MRIQNIQQQSFRAQIDYQGPHTKKSIERQAVKEINRIVKTQARINQTIDILNSDEVKEKIDKLPNRDVVYISTADEDHCGDLTEPFLVYSAISPESRQLDKNKGILVSPSLSLDKKRNLKKSINNWLDGLVNLYGK
ncbi:hypothetical protein IJ425_05130 [bacterium]|nr:hypothetical protein [bacterium]